MEVQQKNAVEEQELIAKFMELETVDTTYGLTYRYGEDLYKPNDLLLLSKSYDWIMPVVEKIESLDLKEWMYQWEMDGETQYNFEGISIEIENNRCWIYVNLQLDPTFTINENSYNINYNTKLEAIYHAVIEFIKWYNERKKTEYESK